MVRPEPTATEPTGRVVLLGASNLVRGLPAAIQVCRNRWANPLDVMAAIGHGRSYGMKHRVLGRTLTGILQCGLWSALEHRPPVPTAALITDVGNDIVFGASVNMISDWVEQCLQRLRPIAESIVVTELPMSSIISIGKTRFFLARRILFPTSSLTRREAIDKASELNERIIALCAKYEAHCASHEAGWYGLDPIHVRRRFYHRAWTSFLTHWNRVAQQETTRFSLCFKARLRFARPAERWMYGVHQTKKQPVLSAQDGTRISLF